MSASDNRIENPKKYFKIHIRVLKGELVDLPLSVVENILKNGIENLRDQGYDIWADELEERRDKVFSKVENVEEDVPISTIHAELAIEKIKKKNLSLEA